MVRFAPDPDLRGTPFDTQLRSLRLVAGASLAGPRTLNNIDRPTTPT